MKKFYPTASITSRQLLFILLLLESLAITLATWGAVASGHSPKAYFEEGRYMLIFLVYAAKTWQTIKLFQRSFIYFQIGLILTVVIIVFNAASNNTLFVSMLTNEPEQQIRLQIWFGTFEDSVKIFAEGLFLVGIDQCWRIAKSF